MGLGEPSHLEQWFGAEAFGFVINVDLRKAEVDNELLGHLGVFKELWRLDLSGAAIDDDGVQRISHLPLRELWLQGTNITDASAPTLTRMRTLTLLQLNATSVSDAFLEHLQTLPELENLGLRGTRVTGAGMKYLSRHPKLKDLDVYNTEVDDAGVAYLVECPALTSIGLSLTKVTNCVFGHLDKIPRLTDADLNANELVTTEAVLEFEKKHPTCDIEWYQSDHR